MRSFVVRATGVGISFGAFALAACVGDQVVPAPIVDSGVGTDSSVTVDSGADAAVLDSATDVGIDAAPPPCGAPGETCCKAPLAPCGDGLTCTTDTQMCAVSDAWAIGSYTTYAPNNGGFVNEIVTAHYDGAAWTRGKDVLVDFGLTAYRPEDIYQVGGQVRAIVTKASSVGGKMLDWNGVSWADCKLGNACVGPTTSADLYAVTSVLNNGGLEFWIGGSNAMYRCPTGASNCTNLAGNIPGGPIGTSQFGGTTAQDLFYGAGDHVVRFNGTSWSSIVVADASTLGDVAKDDMWVGYKQLRHWDGSAFSNAYLIDGAPAPGYIFSIAGSGSKDVFAVGNDSGTASFAAHWDGTGWKKTTLPPIAQVRRVWAPSPIEAFIVGRKEPNTNTGVIEHWNGTAWSVMPSPTITYSGEQQAGSLTWVAVTGRARARRAP